MIFYKSRRTYNDTSKFSLLVHVIYSNSIPSLRSRPRRL